MKSIVAALLVIAANSADAAARQESANGVWKNPSGSVRMRIAPCGKQICGKVVFANAQARADAARGGNPDFVGVNLLRNFSRTGPSSWSGQVFVPDINRTVSGTLTRAGPRSLTVRGCVLGRVGCRDQVWTRIS